MIVAGGGWGFLYYDRVGGWRMEGLIRDMYEKKRGKKSREILRFSRVTKNKRFSSMIGIIQILRFRG